MIELLPIVPDIMVGVAVVAGCYLVVDRIMKVTGLKHYLREKKLQALISTNSSVKIALLRLSGMSMDEPDFFGRTALMKAETADKTRKLLRAGAHPNKTDIYGFTPLMRAETAEQTKLLLKAGADPYYYNISCRSALDYAKTEEQRQLLIEAMERPRKKRGILGAFREALKKTLLKQKKTSDIEQNKSIYRAQGDKLSSADVEKTTKEATAVNVAHLKRTKNMDR